MSRLAAIAVALALPLLGSCPKPGPPAEPAGPTIAKIVELGNLMKNEVNPAFSRLAFLLFHGSTVEGETVPLRTELQTAAGALTSAIGRLRAWSNVPAQTEQGREVFFTYAQAVGRMTDELQVAIAGGDDISAKAKLSRIADTCDRCHHFFRLDVEDSVIPNANRQGKPPVETAFTAPSVLQDPGDPGVPR